MTSGATEAVANSASEPHAGGLGFCRKNSKKLGNLLSLLDRILRSHEVDFRREIGRPVDSLANERGDARSLCETDRSLRLVIVNFLIMSRMR